MIDGVPTGKYTPCIVDVSFTESDEDRKRVQISFRKDFFSDKQYSVTVRRAFTELYVKKLSKSVKICASTDKTETDVTYTFYIGDRYDSCSDIREGNTVDKDVPLELLNQTTGQVKYFTAWGGEGSITIPFTDPFFTEGRQRLICAIRGTHNIIRTFRTITIRRVAAGGVTTFLYIEEGDDWEDYDELPTSGDIEGCEFVDEIAAAFNAEEDEIIRSIERSGGYCTTEWCCSFDQREFCRRVIEMLRRLL